MRDDTAIRALHAAYVALTGLEIVLTMPRICAWEVWQARGWAEADLALVVKLRKSRAKEIGRDLAGCKFRWLVENLDEFDEDLAEARARGRKKPVAPDRAKVLKASGRESEPANAPARTPAQILAGEAAFAEFKKLRDSI